MLRPYRIMSFAGALTFGACAALTASAQSGSYIDQLLNQLPPAAPATTQPQAAPAPHPAPAAKIAKPKAIQPKPVDQPPPAANLAGIWTVQQTNADSSAPAESTLTFTKNGTAFSGTMHRGSDTFPLFEVAVTGSKVSFTLVVPGTPYVTRHYAGTVTGDALSLTSPDAGQGESALNARREKPTQASVPAPAAKAQIIAAAPPAPAAPAPPPVFVKPPQPPQIAAAPPPAPIPASTGGLLNGTWNAKQASPGSATPVTAVLVFAGARGTMRVGADEWPLYDIKTAGTQISFTLVIPGTPYITLNYRGAVTGNTLKLASLDEGQGVFTLEAQREGTVATQATASLAPAPQAPPPPPPAKAVPANPPANSAAAALPENPKMPPAPPRPAPAPANPPASSVAALPDSLKAASTPARPNSIPAAPQLPATLPRVASLSAAPAPVTLPKPIPAPLPAAAPPAPAPAKPPAPPVFVPNFTWIKTPPMGWASREKLGATIDAEAMREAADGLDETGLRAAGYILVEVDEGWQGTRDANGALLGNKNFPDMKALGDYIHSKGLKFGLATAATAKSCQGFDGSYGHENEDAKRFASWGVDVLIYDWCADATATNQADMQAAAERMGQALKASGRDIVFELSQSGAFNVGAWGAKTGANIWRTGKKDIEDSWASVSEIGFAQNGGEAFANPGHWNDPGLLQLGNGTMSGDEYRAQLNLWAVLAAPLMLGNEVRIMTRDTVTALTNPEVIAVDQDAMGLQGKRVAINGETEVWARPLSDGATAVAFFNRSNTSAPVAVSWDQLGIEGPRQIRDVWWHEDIGTAKDRYVVFLNPHTSLLLKMSR